MQYPSVQKEIYELMKNGENHHVDIDVNNDIDIVY